MNQSLATTIPACAIMPCVAAERRCLGPHYQPNEFDVICQRGGAAKRHAGNQRYRQIVNDKLDEYKLAKTKFEKSLIVSAIIDAVRDFSPNGGFVKQDETNGNWYEVGDAAAREKTGQVIRDRLHTMYKSSTKSKRVRRKQLQDRKQPTQQPQEPQRQEEEQPLPVAARGWQRRSTVVRIPVHNHLKSSLRSSNQFPHVHEVHMSLTSLLRMSSTSAGQKRSSSFFLRRPSVLAPDTIRSSFQLDENFLEDKDMTLTQLLRMSSISASNNKRPSSLLLRKRPSAPRRSTMSRSSFVIDEDFEADVSFPNFLQMISEEQKEQNTTRDFDTVMHARNNSLVENNFFLEGNADVSLPNLLRASSRAFSV